MFMVEIILVTYCRHTLMQLDKQVFTILLEQKHDEMQTPL